MPAQGSAARRRPPAVPRRCHRSETPDSTRSTAVLLTSCATGVAAGILAYLASGSVPQALLTTGAAASTTVSLLSQIRIPSSRPSQHRGRRRTR